MDTKKLHIASILVVILCIIIGVKFLNTGYTAFSDAAVETGDYNTSVANETFTITNVSSSYADLSHDDIITSSFTIINSSNNVVFGSGNFTFNAGSGQIALNNGCTSLTEGNCSLWVGSEAKASYAYSTAGIPIMKELFGKSDRAGFIVLGAALIIALLVGLLAYFRIKR